MGHKILNRFDHVEVVSEFSDLTNSYLIDNQHKPSFRNTVKKLIICFLILLVMYLNILNKTIIASNIFIRLLLLIFLILSVIIYKKIDIQDGLLIGQYTYKNQYVVYTLSYIPLTTRCLLIERKFGVTREREFAYNEYINQSGKIMQRQYLQLVQKFIQINTSILVQDY